MPNIGVHTSQHLTAETARAALTARMVPGSGHEPQITIGGAGRGFHLVMGIEEAALLMDSLDVALAAAQERHLTLVAADLADADDLADAAD